MAKDSGHLEKLAGVLEERLGSKPRLEIRAAGGEASATSTAEEPTPMEQHAPVSQESPPETGSPNGSGGTVAENSGSEPASMGDDKIRDQREVFEIAREAGLFDKN
jgi:hypothetical protein